MNITRCTVVVALMGCILAPASAGIVALDGGPMAVIAQQGNPYQFQYAMAPQGPTYPQSQSGSATAGNSSGSATYTIDRNLVTLTTQFQRDGSYFNDSLVSTTYAMGAMEFTVDADSYYALSGQHVLTGGQRISLQVNFDDLTTGTRPFHQYQYSEQTPNEVLNVGQADGEYSEMTGTAVGPLVAGHRYSLSFNYAIVNPLGADGGASAIGGLNVILCPEPTSGLLLALGVLGLLRRR